MWLRGCLSLASACLSLAAQDPRRLPHCPRLSVRLTTGWQLYDLLMAVAVGAPSHSAQDDPFVVNAHDLTAPQPPGSYPQTATSSRGGTQPHSRSPKTASRSEKPRSGQSRLRRAAAKAAKHRGTSIRKQLLKTALADKRTLARENAELLAQLEEDTAAHETSEAKVKVYEAQVLEMETAMRDLVSQHIVQLQSRESALRRAQEEVTEAKDREKAHDARMTRIEEMETELDMLRRANQAMLVSPSISIHRP